MKTSCLLAAALLLLCAPPRVLAAAAGGEPFNFLFLDANARAVGMGGAYTALANDSNALLYNPAGLGAIDRSEATFMHNQYFQGVTQEYIGVAMKQGLGLHLNYLSYGRIPRTTISQPNGAGSDFGISDLAVGGGYGRRIGEDVSVGAGLKFIRESIDNFSANTFGFDLGSRYAPQSVPGLAVGLAVQNIGPSVTFQRASENLPLNVRGGAAYQFNAFDAHHTFAFDLSKERSENTLFGLGWESVIGKMMALRFGFNSRNDAGIGIVGGLGWLNKNYSVDYSIAPLGDLGMAHRISLSYRWGEGAEPQAAPREERPTRAVASPVSPARLLRDAETATAAGRFDAVRAALEKLERTRPSGSEVLAHIAVIRGEAAYAQGKNAEARGFFEEASETLGGVTADDLASRAFAGLARVSLERGDARGAAQMLRKALETAPDEDYAIGLRAEFKKLRGEFLNKNK